MTCSPKASIGVGSARVDLSQVDHLAIAGESLASVRERFNVVPLANPMVTDPA